MELTEQDRLTIRGRLMSDRYRPVLNGLNPNDMTDKQLVAYNHLACAKEVHRACFNEATGRLEITLPDGSKMFFDPDRATFIHQPANSPAGAVTRNHAVVSPHVPVALPVKTPKIAGMPVNEFFSLGGGTEEDRQMYHAVQNARATEKADLIAQLTVNADGEAQEAAVRLYAAFTNEQLKDLVAAHRANQTQQPAGQTPTINYFGAQGGPVGGYGGYSHALNEAPPEAPSLFQPKN